MKTCRVRVSIVICLVGAVLLVGGCIPGEQAYVRIEDSSLVRFAGDGQRYLCLVAVNKTQEFGRIRPPRGSYDFSRRSAPPNNAYYKGHLRELECAHVGAIQEYGSA